VEGKEGKEQNGKGKRSEGGKEKKSAASGK